MRFIPFAPIAVFAGTFNGQVAVIARPTFVLLTGRFFAHFHKAEMSSNAGRSRESHITVGAMRGLNSEE